MRAWQYVGTGEPLARVELPEPVAGAGEVVVDVRAAGLCHTDVAIMDGPTSSILGQVPIVLGHEVAGVVRELGPGVTGVRVGDRVGIDPSGGFHGPGVGRDGGYAAATIGRVGELVPIPDGVGFEQAASGCDAGATSHHAVRAVAQVTAGTRVGVIGLGGLGQVGARIAVLAGAEVHVADVRAELEDVARGLGAQGFVTDVADLAPLGLDVLIDFAGMRTTGPAIDAVRPGGRVVQVGAGAPEATISVERLVIKRVELLGTLGSERADLESVYQLMASGELDPVITTLGFDDIPAGLDQLRRGEATGRLIARYAD
ncbi:alcohol dehydrogenase catalytic domain-containing protein [uncultured Modestobacter sp.]|uniref:alcohol dehydrogenase catalytic domain-containing protein n=1 Tax=uncultured Modestobacter sp. TaxID=380048 RepID=UPI00260C33CE|nr:alcohol dehydrogenase catalytic domain-containing protein [uncultured Modestobacter sp.]